MVRHMNVLEVRQQQFCASSRLAFALSSRDLMSRFTSCDRRGLHSSFRIPKLKLRVPILLILFSFALANAWGAIAIDATVSKNATSASSTITSPAFSTTAVNELLLAYVSTDWNSG